MNKIGILMLLGIFVFIANTIAVEMNYQCFGFGGGEDTLAIQQHVGTYGNTYIGCFYPVSVISVPPSPISPAPTDSYYYQQQQQQIIKDCTDKGWAWNGTACIQPTIKEIIEPAKEVLKKQGKNIIPMILAVGYIAMVFLRRRKKRMERRREDIRKKKLEELEKEREEEIGPKI